MQNLHRRRLAEAYTVIVITGLQSLEARRLSSVSSPISSIVRYQRNVPFDSPSQSSTASRTIESICQVRNSTVENSGDLLTINLVAQNLLSKAQVLNRKI